MLIFPTEKERFVLRVVAICTLFLRLSNLLQSYLIFGSSAASKCDYSMFFGWVDFRNSVSKKGIFEINVYKPGL